MSEVRSQKSDVATSDVPHPEKRTPMGITSLSLVVIDNHLTSDF
jgi:hypothetical protein